MSGRVAYVPVLGVCYDVILQRDVAEAFVNAVRTAKGKISYQQVLPIIRQFGLDYKYEENA